MEKAIELLGEVAARIPQDQPWDLLQQGIVEAKKGQELIVALTAENETLKAKLAELTAAPAAEAVQAQ
jgi:hypothetical protein